MVRLVGVMALKELIEVPEVLRPLTTRIKNPFVVVVWRGQRVTVERQPY
jgi:hypothetical protein